MEQQTLLSYTEYEISTCELLYSLGRCGHTRANYSDWLGVWTL